MGRDGPIIPASAEIETSYETGRPEKPKKIVSRAVVDHASPFEHIELLLLKFKAKFAMDTNMRIIQGTAVHVTAICELVEDTKPPAEKPRLDIYETVGIEFRNPTASAEQLGWLKFIKNYKLNALKGRPGSVAILTDHDMANIEAYNRRQKRIAGVMYLPREFTLVYACADRAPSQFVNMAVGMADHLSNRLLDMIEKNFDYCGELQAGDRSTPCESWRWHEPTGHQAFDSVAEGKRRAPARQMIRPTDWPNKK